ncbi:MAG TPA: hypothetical protein VG963_19105 [Polyangiaceae bacterium]|nr:hypothetical protein [Polyangiaceae bacterium]
MLRIGEDDALWILCGLVQRFDALLREYPDKCVATAEQALDAELVMLEAARSKNEAWQPPMERDETDLVLRLVLGTVGVAFTILTAVVGFVLGDAFRGGHARWVPISPFRGPLLSALAALLKAPIGGAAMLAGFVVIGLCWAAWRWGRSRG